MSESNLGYPFQTDYLENEMTDERTDHRPWGRYTILADEPDHKVKRIVVNPGKRFSLQRHQRRSEHWFIISGEALVTIGDSKQRLCTAEAIDIPFGTLHRMENPGNRELSFIEVQTGDYFGEDDIERFEDDFGRVEA